MEQCWGPAMPGDGWMNEFRGKLILFFWLSHDPGWHHTASSHNTIFSNPATELKPHLPWVLLRNPYLCLLLPNYLLSRLLEAALEAEDEAALDWEHWTQFWSVMVIRMLQWAVLMMTMMMRRRSGQERKVRWGAWRWLQSAGPGRPGLTRLCHPTLDSLHTCHLEPANYFLSIISLLNENLKYYFTISLLS